MTAFAPTVAPYQPQKQSPVERRTLPLAIPSQMVLASDERSSFE